jgi:hypothetical protein
MSEKAISEATDRAVPLGTDMLPVAVSGSTTAYYVTLDDLIESIPMGTVTRKGLMQLAYASEVQSVTESARVVTPAGLAGSVNAKMLIPGCFSLGRINELTLTKALIGAKFLEVTGRTQVTGDIVTTEDKNDYPYILGYFSGSVTKGWFGVQITGSTTGNFKSYV